MLAGASIPLLVSSASSFVLDTVPFYTKRYYLTFDAALNDLAVKYAASQGPYPSYGDDGPSPEEQLLATIWEVKLCGLFAALAVILTFVVAIIWRANRDTLAQIYHDPFAFEIKAERVAPSLTSAVAAAKEHKSKRRDSLPPALPPTAGPVTTTTAPVPAAPMVQQHVIAHPIPTAAGGPAPVVRQRLRVSGVVRSGQQARPLTAAPAPVNSLAAAAPVAVGLAAHSQPLYSAAGGAFQVPAAPSRRLSVSHDHEPPHSMDVLAPSRLLHSGSTTAAKGSIDEGSSIETGIEDSSSASSSSSSSSSQESGAVASVPSSSFSSGQGSFVAAGSAETTAASAAAASAAAAELKAAQEAQERRNLKANLETATRQMLEVLEATTGGGGIVLAHASQAHAPAPVAAAAPLPSASKHYSHHSLHHPNHHQLQQQNHHLHHERLATALALPSHVPTSSAFTASSGLSSATAASSSSTASSSFLAPSATGVAGAAEGADAPETTSFASGSNHEPWRQPFIAAAALQDEEPSMVIPAATGGQGDGSSAGSLRLDSPPGADRRRGSVSSSSSAASSTSLGSAAFVRTPDRRAGLPVSPGAADPGIGGNGAAVYSPQTSPSGGVSSSSRLFRRKPIPTDLFAGGSTHVSPQQQLQQSRSNHASPLSATASGGFAQVFSAPTLVDAPAAFASSDTTAVLEALNNESAQGNDSGRSMAPEEAHASSTWQPVPAEERQQEEQQVTPTAASVPPTYDDNDAGSQTQDSSPSALPPRDSLLDSAGAEGGYNSSSSAAVVSTTDGDTGVTRETGESGPSEDDDDEEREGEDADKATGLGRPSSVGSVGLRSPSPTLTSVPAAALRRAESGVDWIN